MQFSSTTCQQLAPQQRLVVVQRNPTSGSGRGRQELLTLIAELRQRQFRVRMFSKRPQLDAWLTRPEIRTSLRCIVAAGGDGTVADLTNRQHGIPLAILPLGTENLLARSLGIRRCGRQLAELIDAGCVCRLDSGLAAGRRFLLMLSAGVDAAIVHRMHALRRGHIRHTSYIGPILHCLCRFRPPLIHVTTPDSPTTVSGSHVLITNVPAYGFGFRFSPDAVPDDGLLDIRVFHGRSRFSTAVHAVCVRLGLPWAERQVTRWQVPAVRLTAAATDCGVPAQVDGDPAPPLPVDVQIDPQSLSLIVPAALRGTQSR